jgi:tRNA dimethylallyltransferase
MNPKNKILCIVGPTASGKSGLAISLARRYNGEVISADSRQVYRGLDIGTGKVTEEEKNGVPHHLLDVADPIIGPRGRYSVSNWRESADRAVNDILEKGRLPIVCGGTGFYIEALVDGTIFPEVPADPELRKNLGEKTCDELFLMLEELDHARASSVDRKNKRRIIRAIEIARALGHVPGIVRLPDSERDVLMIGVETPDAELKDKIYVRLITRLDQGMIDESRRLHSNGLSYERMDELGLEYRYISEYLKREFTDNPMSREELINTLSTKIWQYARRQKTWFKRDKRIEWYKISDEAKISKRVEKWLQGRPYFSPFG